MGSLTNFTQQLQQKQQQQQQQLLSDTVEILVSVVVSVLIVFSLFGNLLLCNIVFRRAAMRSGINLLLANLALSDFANAVLNLPLSVVLFNMGTWPLGDVACRINGALCFTMNIVKVLTLTTISIDRYLIIVKRKDTMTPWRANAVIASSWTFAAAVSVLPVIGWGRFKFRCGYIQCLLDVESGGNMVESYLIFVTAVTVFIPAAVFLFVYTRILRTVHRSNFRVENHPPITPTAMHVKGRLFIDYGYKRRTSATILLLCLLLMACLLPIGVLNIVVALNGFHKSVHLKTYTAFLWLSHLHGALNPIVYFQRIKKFRESLLEVGPKVVSLAGVVSQRSRRRIRPHVTYQVDKNDIKVSCINLSAHF